MERWSWTFLRRLQSHLIHSVHMPLSNDLRTMTFHYYHVSPRQSSMHWWKYNTNIPMWWISTCFPSDTWQFLMTHLLVVFCKCPQHPPKPIYLEIPSMDLNQIVGSIIFMFVQKHLRSKKFLSTKQQSLLVKIHYFWVVNDSKFPLSIEISLLLMTFVIASHQRHRLFPSLFLPLSYWCEVLCLSYLEPLTVWSFTMI